MCPSFFGKPSEVVKLSTPASRSAVPNGEMLVIAAPPAGVT